MIYAIVQGYSYPYEINYCPYRGGEIDSCDAAGYCHCSDCGKQFAVIEYVKQTEKLDA